MGSEMCIRDRFLCSYVPTDVMRAGMVLPCNPGLWDPSIIGGSYGWYVPMFLCSYVPTDVMRAGMVLPCNPGLWDPSLIGGSYCWYSNTTEE